MNLNFCARLHLPIGSGANNPGVQTFGSIAEFDVRTLWPEMSRTSIVALVVFVAGLGYLLSLGAGGTRKLQANVYQLSRHF